MVAFTLKHAYSIYGMQHDIGGNNCMQALANQFSANVSRNGEIHPGSLCGCKRSLSGEPNLGFILGDLCAPETGIRNNKDFKKQTSRN